MNEKPLCLLNSSTTCILCEFEIEPHPSIDNERICQLMTEKGLTKTQAELCASCTSIMAEEA